MNHSSIIHTILTKRGIENIDEFLNPDYKKLHNPALLPDFNKAIKRIKEAKEQKDKVYIYGDYDIDGLTATTIMLEALTAFGVEADYYMPDRFNEGYGMSKQGVDHIKESDGDLIITVDCGSRSIEEIAYANKAGIDVIVTDHHECAEILPDAVAIVNPKRQDSKYPWRDLAGVGVAFKLILALQKELKGLDDGQEKWLLDLVALGTVCDVVDLLDENRTLVYWGLKVASKTRRHGLIELAKVSSTDLSEVDSEVFGFRFGPRLNASGRLEHASLSLNLLRSNDPVEAEKLASKLDQMNYQRRQEQARILKEATEMAGDFQDNDVLVLADKSWSHGINGIVASSLVEATLKPTFVMQILEGEIKGSGRSYGDYHLADALKSVQNLLVSGGGHHGAAGATIKTDDLEKFRKGLNDYYQEMKLKDQAKHLDPVVDLEADDFSMFSVEFIRDLNRLEPFGNGNNEPLFESKSIRLDNWRAVGSDQSHAKATFIDQKNNKIESIGFRLAKQMPEPKSVVDIIYTPKINQFNGRVSSQLNLKAISLA